MIDCGPLTDPANGQVNTSSGTTFGSTATYSCDTGYKLSGSLSRTCRADGSWSNTIPSCQSTYVYAHFVDLMYIGVVIVCLMGSYVYTKI